MSTHPVLSISELLNHIFLAAPDPEPSDILKLALVSKCWSEVALPLLWSHPVHHEMWMSGHELERVGSVCKLELLKCHELGIEDPSQCDYSRVTKYSAYLQSISISYSQPEWAFRYAKFLHRWQYEVFPSLKEIEFEYHRVGREDGGAMLMNMVFLIALGPTVKTVKFKSWDVYPVPDAFLAATVEAIAARCPDLTTLDIRYAEINPIPYEVIMPHLASMKNLETLVLRPSILTSNSWATQLSLASLPRLKYLEFASLLPMNVESLRPYVEPPAEELQTYVQPSTDPDLGEGFKNLERLKLEVTTSVAHGLLSVIGHDCSVSDIDLRISSEEEEDSGDAKPFPSGFVIQGLKRLSIKSALNTVKLCTNILDTIGNFSSLTSIEIESRTLLRASDKQLAAALRNCHVLRTLQLHPYATRFSSSKVKDRPSLGCLVDIVAHCPLLEGIEGCFDMDEDKLPPDTTNIVPSPKFRFINLANSYLVTSELSLELGAKIGAYLGSLSQQRVGIILGFQMCADLDAVGNAWMNHDFGRRMDFDQAIHEANAAATKLKKEKKEKEWYVASMR